MKAITNATIVLWDHLIFDGVILVEDGFIERFGEARLTDVPRDAEVIDAKGAYVGPGLVDIHSHSGGTHWFYDDPVSAAQSHLAHGVTSILPALYFNLSKEEYLAAIDKIKKAAQTKEAANIKGLYVEGPYLNPKFGADAENNRWCGAIDKNEYMPVVEAAGDFAKIWCVAPEREGIEGFVRDVCARISGIPFAVAHSEASPRQIEKLMPYGLRLATHHTNATGDLPRYPECRGVCVDETVNYYDEIYAELISDSRGIHVDPFMLRLVLKIKGRDKVILISDSCVFDGPVPPGYEGVTDINFDHQEQIAGSKLTLDVACKNMMKHTGAGLCDLFRFASYNPAKLARLDKLGLIAEGNIADLVFVDHMVNVLAVMQNGEMVKQ